MNKTLSKYIAALIYFENILLVLSAASGGASIASFAIYCNSCTSSNNKSKSWFRAFYEQRNC